MSRPESEALPGLADVLERPVAALPPAARADDAAAGGGIAPATPRRIYYLHPLLAGRLESWPKLLQHIAGLGFDCVLLAPVFAPAPGGVIFLAADLDRLHPALGYDGDALSGLARMAGMIRAAGMRPLLDIVLDRVAAGGRLAAQAGGLYADPQGRLDPRNYGDEADAARLAAVEPAAFTAFWSPHLTSWLEAGFIGGRIDALAALGPDRVRSLIGAVRQAAPDGRFLGWTPGIPMQALPDYVDCGLDAVFSSLPWWDFAADWLFAERACLRRIAPVLACPEAPFDRRLAATNSADRAAVLRRAIGFAAAVFDGWMLPMGTEFAAVARLDRRRETAGAWERLVAGTPADAAGHVCAANHFPPPAEMPLLRPLTAPGSRIAAILRTDADPRVAGHARFTLINNDLRQALAVPAPAILSTAGGRFLPFRPDASLVLEPGEVAVFEAAAESPILLTGAPLADTARYFAAQPRLAIEAVSPVADGGRFAVRRVAGELVTVEADVFCDGHGVLGVALLWRERGVATWQRQKMLPIGNDRFAGSFPLARIGMHEFTVEAWRDDYASFRDELAKKHAAGVATASEVAEGRKLVTTAIDAVSADLGVALRGLDQQLDQADQPEQIALLLSEPAAALMTRADRRPFATTIEPPYMVEAERLTARFASWYEVFPRSMSDDVNRHGTFDDVIRHLPRIRDLGFDVLYFPPIHPIGRAHRKGPNNSLTPGPEDPGSPYAIGGEEGGHTALHPELGSFEDFRRLIAAATDMGIEIALDFAIQCSPDHPWLREHPEWFDWRPDGTVKYAENPPKKYQDIVNVDFYAPGAIPGLWLALCEVVLFWADQGVRIFRVDNPHTKPLPFWQWMIGEVKSRHPDTMFLAEAFTRPKMMYRLAKVGFTQSYSYFTWRNEKAELSDYLTELTTSAAKEFFRPNFFVNTPDINPVFLQSSGRNGFIIRATLAATLSGLWGVYNGFELCEAAALPGREEYLDAEKYQLRAWDWERPGNINAEIAALNRIRRANPALQTHLGLRFLPTSNAAVLAYEKALPDRSNVIFVAVNLDPHNAHESQVEVPLWLWGLPDDASLEIEDLLTHSKLVWHGKYQTLRLDPVAIFQVRQ